MAALPGLAEWLRAYGSSESSSGGSSLDAGCPMIDMLILTELARCLPSGGQPLARSAGSGLGR